MSSFCTLTQDNATLDSTHTIDPRYRESNCDFCELRMSSEENVVRPSGLEMEARTEDKIADRY